MRLDLFSLVCLLILLTPVTVAITYPSQKLIPVDKSPDIHSEMNKFPIGEIPKIIPDQLAALDWKQILNETGLKWLHEQGFKGQQVKIGIIDNGVDFLHPAFENKQFQEKSFIDQLGEESTQTHGTPVAGILSGYEVAGINGSAPLSAIYSAEMGSDPSDQIIKGNFTAAIEWLAQNGVKLINTSFGGFYNWTSLIKVAKQYGIIIVGSAGNDGSNSPPSGPGADPYAIAAGAISSSFLVEGYSSRGPTTEYYQKPDLVSFGSVETINVINGTNVYSGTSFSTPIVTGGIASIISALDFYNKNWTVGSIKAALLQSGRVNLGTPEAQGSGLTNFTKAFLMLNNSNQLGAVFPSNHVPKEFETIPSNFDYIYPVQIVVSNKSKATIELQDQLSGLLFPSEISDFTSLPLVLNSNGKNEGTYKGRIIVQVDGMVVSNQSLSITIQGTLKGLIGVDYYHSPDYVTGSENLLNRNNEWAKQMRENGFWPEYILEEFTIELLNRFDILFMKNVFSNEAGLLIDEFTNQTLTSSELDILMQYQSNGGKIFFAFQSDGITYESDLNEVIKLLQMLNMNISNIDENLIQFDMKVKNFTYIGKHTQFIQFKGYDISGGRSVFLHGNGIVINNAGFDKVVVSSSLDIMNYPKFIVDSMEWLMMPEDYVILDVQSKDQEVDISYQGGNYSYDTAKIVRKFYNETVENVSLGQVQTINGKGSLQFPVEEGKYDVIIKSIVSNNYLKISSSSHNSLIIDYKPPTLQFIGNSTDLLINETSGKSTKKVILSYNDNNDVNVSRTMILIGNKTQTFDNDPDQKTIWFFISATLFNDADSQNVYITIFDYSNNKQSIQLEITIIRILLPVPEQVPVTITAEEETVNIDYRAFRSRIINTILIVFGLLGFVAILRYAEVKG